ncbi:hypothetical protein COY17_01640 [Candidatus Saccharibacteria bacterium CG_4_10_14_0_2_um_filter_52_9]|nr:MAG: hypothetical protein COY17_01640 [Candidatus Saccharibacteria bacterium CG_4_10_14_0_2_um_filter_52_9]
MRAVNHALTGALIGLTVAEPAVAVPAAVVSHYICDVIPHYGSSQKGDTSLRASSFRSGLYIDAALCLGIVVLLAVRQPSHWLLAAVCAFAAAAPDLLSANRYFKVVARKRWQPNLYSRFATGIQWFERPIGAVVETAWLVATIIILWPFIR